MYEGQYMSYEEYPELALGGDFNYIRVYDDGTFERLMSMFMIEGVWEKTESDLADHVYLLKSQQSRLLDDEWQEADSMYYLLLDEENPDVIELMWLDDAGDSEMTYVYERVYSAE
jgi:hypothetical protein